MLQLQQGSTSRNCQGMSRRSALKAGFLGLAGLSLADILRMQAQAGTVRKDTSVILMWLDGGPSQLETYDPKPDAPVEYRGPYGIASTNVPGITITDRLPLSTRHADKMVILRSVHHNTGDHFAGGHWMLTGHGGATSASPTPRFPSFGSYVSKIRGANDPAMPAYVGLPAAQCIYVYPGYQGSAFLGQQYNPFDVNREQIYLAASHGPIDKPKCLQNFGGEQDAQIRGRSGLLSGLDHLHRNLDQSGTMEALDRYQQQAMTMILGGKARKALDLDREDPRTIDKYGRNPWGMYTLMARRMVEAGVTFCTVDMPHWDDHSGIDKGHGYKLPAVDRAFSSLMEDLEVRGMLDRVLVIVMGEFGRTPRINTGQPGIPIPGRDHWGNCFSVVMAGGGLRGGQVIGKSSSKAEFPVERPLRPGDVLATVYKVMGIDTTQSFPDHRGRPIPMLDEGHPIREAF